MTYFNKTNNPIDMEIYLSIDLRGDSRQTKL